MIWCYLDCKWVNRRDLYKLWRLVQSRQCMVECYRSHRSYYLYRTIVEPYCRQYARNLCDRGWHTHIHTRTQSAQSDALNLALFASLCFATLFAAWAACVYRVFFLCGPRDIVIRLFPPRLIRAHSRAHALATKFALVLDRRQSLSDSWQLARFQTFHTFVGAESCCASESTQ